MKKILVLIVQTESAWQLRIKYGHLVLWKSDPQRLIDVVNLAKLLRVHVDNIDALPLTQYKKQGEGYDRRRPSENFDVGNVPPLAGTSRTKRLTNAA